MNLSFTYYFLLLLGITLLLSPAGLQGQETDGEDALLLKLSEAGEDTAKVKALLDLTHQTSWTDIDASQGYARQALDLSQRLNYEKGIAYAKFWLSKIFFR